MEDLNKFLTRLMEDALKEEYKAEGAIDVIKQIHDRINPDKTCQACGYHYYKDKSTHKCE